MKFSALLILYILISTSLNAQIIPSNKVLPPGNLKKHLTKQVQKDLKGADATELAQYFRNKFSERFFYDYQTFYDRLQHYNSIYKNQESHKEKALDHIGKYKDSTQWVLPFNYQNGEPVNAYALRHLARQHKMVDIALYYFNGTKDPELIRYFETQMRSLNAALHADKYEKIEDGNGVYEAFRSGYRILNWLWIHNMFLNEPDYSDEDQLVTIATLLQHGQHLYERNDSFNSGNHQTRGVSALAMLAILFRDFEGTDLWLERAMRRLGEHLDKEINDDGFQFERSVHYHMSDINNYYYVYQLAKLNGIEIDEAWEDKLRGLFTTLVKIAYPDRSAPVLQDDTEIPWGEKNDISGAMTLGYLLFEDPEFGYFATDKVDDRVYWFLSNDQIKLLENIDQQRPTYGSLSFDDTGYYIMREGWNPDDKMMIISAGLDDKKPDHQHGDMLGIQAIANGHAILPNYQVRYSLKDFGFFKNSMVKNVALVDDQLQGKQYTSNQGGSGFGKFKELPNPEVLTWNVNDNFDLFVGRHDGFSNVGVNYTRQVIFVKDDFWIVKDEFQSDGKHDYKQVWQGHYTHENGSDLLRATAADGAGHDILQLIKTDSVFSDGTRGKQWSVVSKKEQNNFSFLTVIYPYKGYSNRLDETTNAMNIGKWGINTSEWRMTGENATNVSHENESYFFGVTRLDREIQTIEFSEESDIYFKEKMDQFEFQNIGSRKSIINIKQSGNKVAKELQPGEAWSLSLRSKQ
ncbi:heparinase [Fulvivirga sp. RKSG066]|uniref:heparinase II/III family protein n=1 Tax=Fulvivirga aurantia TaxID=2529383 RepID=UPI0012BD5826|nr:heparinase II/III family protein [Fulvivirga aurantia]MTI20795.1 heparinase [Fulvivirga aurantia]